MWREFMKWMGVGSVAAQAALIAVGCGAESCPLGSDPASAACHLPTGDGGADASGECIEAAACDTGNPCAVGRVDCRSGAPVCVPDFTVPPPSTTCGVLGVCGTDGLCSECISGAVCDTGSPCSSGLVDCSTGTARCVATVDLPAGVSCGTRRICDASGACVACATTEACNGLDDDCDGVIDNDASCPCSVPWGGTILHGRSVTAFAESSVYSPAACMGETRTCYNGTLSGSYTMASCSVLCDLASGGACTWIGGPYQGCNPFESVWCSDPGQSLYQKIRLGITDFCGGDYEWQVWCYQPGNIQCDSSCS